MPYHFFDYIGLNKRKRSVLSDEDEKVVSEDWYIHEPYEPVSDFIDENLIDPIGLDNSYVEDSKFIINQEDVSEFYLARVFAAEVTGYTTKFTVNFKHFELGETVGTFTVYTEPVDGSNKSITIGIAHESSPYVLVEYNRPIKDYITEVDTQDLIGKTVTYTLTHLPDGSLQMIMYDEDNETVLASSYFVADASGGVSTPIPDDGIFTQFKWQDSSSSDPVEISAAISKNSLGNPVITMVEEETYEIYDEPDAQYPFDYWGYITTAPLDNIQYEINGVTYGSGSELSRFVTIELRKGGTFIRSIARPGVNLGTVDMGSLTSPGEYTIGYTLKHEINQIGSTILYSGESDTYTSQAVYNTPLSPFEIASVNNDIRLKSTGSTLLQLPSTDDFVIDYDDSRDNRTRVVTATYSLKFNGTQIQTGDLTTQPGSWTEISHNGEGEYEALYYYQETFTDPYGNAFTESDTFTSQVVTILPPTSDDVWLFYSTGANFSYQCINRFLYNGASGEGGQYSLDYDHVTLYDRNESRGVLPENGDGSASDTAVGQSGSSNPGVMNSTLEEGFGQLVWVPGSTSSPLLVFSIKIPGDHPTSIPDAGWSWNQGAVSRSQLGQWDIYRNGQQLSHNATTSPSGSGQAFRNIQ